MWRSATTSNVLRHLLRRPQPLLRPLTTTPTAPSDLVVSISTELTKLSNSTTPTDIDRHFSLHFSDVHVTTPLLSSILNLSPAAGRPAADLFRWLVLRRSFHPSDHALSLLIHHLGRRKDFKQIDELFVEFSPHIGPLSLLAALDRLLRADRISSALRLFNQFPRTRHTLSQFVELLTKNKYPGRAEAIVNQYSHEIFPDEAICNSLIRGWCIAGKLDEARRLMSEIERGGFAVGTHAYNSILDCVCRLCRRKDPLRIQSEAEKVLFEMESRGIARDAETFRVLIENLCKIRRTEDAMGLFRRMSEWGCSPDGETYLILIRSLYQAARVSEGDEMCEWMKSAGFGDLLDRKAYYGFIKILCGIERVEHAMKVFRTMKYFGHALGVKSYDLLYEKLVTHNLAGRADALFNEAVAHGIPIARKAYKVDKRYVKVKEEKKEKKRLTLPEKTKLKKRRLKRLRLSFVKKPRSSGRRRMI